MNGTMANFKVHYAIDNTHATHLLAAQGYARSAKAPLNSWALLE